MTNRAPKDTPKTSKDKKAKEEFYIYSDSGLTRMKVTKAQFEQHERRELSTGGNVAGMQADFEDFDLPDMPDADDFGWLFYH